MKYLFALGVLAGCAPTTPDAPVVPVALVSVGTVSVGAVAETVTLFGAVENNAAARFALSAPVEAIVTAIEAPVGTPVRRGQIVARLAPSPTSRLDLVKAQGDARLAVETAARASRLRADGLVGDAEVETARAAANSATATLTSLTGRTGGLVLRATVAGFVETVVPAAGDLVAAGGPVATIARAGDLRARFGVEPALARRIDRGASLLIVPTGADASFAARVLSVDPVVDPTTRLASVYAAIPFETGLGAGETLSIQLRVTASTAGLTIPYAAVLDDGGQPYVYLVVGGVARRRDIVSGAATGDRIGVTRGLRRGERVVTAGGTALEDGMRVRLK